MSTTIDAAIIKALVEHIGGDSSGIPDGTIGGSSTVADETWDTVNWSSMESTSETFTPNVVTIDGTDYIALSYNDTGSHTVPPNFGIRLYLSKKGMTEIYQMIMLPCDGDNVVAIGQCNQNGYKSYSVFTFNSYTDRDTDKRYYYCQWLTTDKYDINSFRVNNDVHFTTFTQQICLKYILEKITQLSKE